MCFIIAAANKEFRLTAGKFVPVCNSTLMNVRILTIQRNNSGYGDRNTDLDKNTILSSLCHADYSTPDFPLHNRVEAHFMLASKFAFECDLTLQQDIYSEINNVITLLIIKPIIFPLSNTL